jgi:hypothetical protein
VRRVAPEREIGAPGTHVSHVIGNGQGGHRGSRQAELIGQGAQLAGGAEALVNRGALAVMADRARPYMSGQPPV